MPRSATAYGPANEKAVVAAAGQQRWRQSAHLSSSPSLWGAGWRVSLADTWDGASVCLSVCPRAPVSCCTPLVVWIGNTGLVKGSVCLVQSDREPSVARGPPACRLLGPCPGGLTAGPCDCALQGAVGPCAPAGAAAQLSGSQSVVSSVLSSFSTAEVFTHIVF